LRQQTLLSAVVVRARPVQVLAVAEPVTLTDTDEGRVPALALQVMVTVLPLDTAASNGQPWDRNEGRSKA
jgi:hypothetical protein